MGSGPVATAPHPEHRLEDAYPAFSCPAPEHVATLDALVPVVVREYGAGVCAAFVGRHGARIAAASRSLIEYLGTWFVEPSVVAEGGWDYGFGNLYRSHSADAADHAWCCAVIAGQLGAAGLGGRWSASFERPGRLRWGRWLLPRATRLEVEGSGDAARIAYDGPDGPGEVRLARQDGEWRSTAGDEQRRVARHGVAFDLLAREAIDLVDFREFDGRVVPAVEPRMVPVFHDALDIIRSYTPEYVPWVARVLHQVFLLQPTGERVESGSVENYLGLVHLSEHPEPLPVAELLVHEASHQYMNVVRKVEPLDDGSDSRTYWSPPVSANRPIAKIIAALHAFGNVQLFYRLCAARGLPNRAECERQEKIMQDWLDVLVPPTLDNPAMTASGNALCRPILRTLAR